MSQRVDSPPFLRAVALDGKDHRVSVSTTRKPHWIGTLGPASMGFDAHTVGVKQYFTEDESGRFGITISNDGERSSGFDSLGVAQEHGVHIRMFGVQIDGISIESSVLDPDQLGFEPVHNDRLFDRRLVVPLTSGLVTLELSQFDLVKRAS